MTEKEYNESVTSWSDDIYRFAIRCCDDTAVSQDAVQEAFASLWQKRETIEADKAKGYLFSVAYHTAINHHRRQKVRRQAEPELLATTDSYVSPNEEFDLAEAINRALSQLPEVQRALMQLRDIEGYSFEEIGNMLQLSTQQVHVYLFRARATMKKLLLAQGYGNG